MKLALPIHALTEQIKRTYSELLTQEATAVNTALYLGAMLNEAKEIVGHGEFLNFRTKTLPSLSDARAQRYMLAAANVVKQINFGACDIPVSRLLSCAAEDLPDDAAREARQLLFDFTDGRTIKECLAGVFIDGDAPVLITRAANGQKHGGYKGEDRKDYPKFIGVHLSDISAHLKPWKSYTGAQVESTETVFKSALAKWPTPVLTFLKKLITEELKTR